MTLCNLEGSNLLVTLLPLYSLRICRAVSSGYVVLESISFPLVPRDVHSTASLTHMQTKGIWILQADPKYEALLYIWGETTFYNGFTYQWNKGPTSTSRGRDADRGRTNFLAEGLADEEARSSFMISRTSHSAHRPRVYLRTISRHICFFHRLKSNPTLYMSSYRALQ